MRDRILLIARYGRLGLGSVGAVGLLLTCFWLWDQAGFTGPDCLYQSLCQSMAVWAMAASQFVFMVLVADDLYPRMPMVVAGILKLFTGALWWGALLYSVWLIWRIA